MTFPTAVLSCSLLSLFISLWAGCATTPEAVRKEQEEEALQDVSREARDEKQIGQAIAASLLSTYPLLKSQPQLSEYLTVLGQSLTLFSTRAGWNFRFAVLDSPEINAFATPGGYVFVTTGLLALTENESEVAAILAHEIAHVTEQHLHREVSPKRKVTAAETLARIASQGRGDLGGSLSKIVSAGMKMLLERGLGMEKETEADQVGVQILVAAGYDPHSPLQVLRKIEARLNEARKRLKSPSTQTASNEQELLEEQARISQVPKTHPPFEERIAKLQAYLKENQLSPRKLKQPEVERRFASVQTAFRKPDSKPQEAVP